MNVSVAQFQPKDGDKTYNLSVIRQLAKRAKSNGADVVSFHEMSITAYSFIKDLTLEEITSFAEEVPSGNSTQELIKISKELDIPILAGLLEKSEDKIYNTYICVTKDGVIAKHRKIHAFISEHISSGSGYCVFDLLGWSCGILIGYDNNVIENVRATRLFGAELIFAPHVTGCTPSPMPHRGYVEDKYWCNRKHDPVSLRMEFDGPKGRGWLMRWLPARAFDNGVYYAFSNPIGYDGEYLKNGNSMILDPHGDVLSEIKSFENELTMAKITKEKIKLSGGWRYRQARRPELYKEILSQENKSETRPVWLKSKNS